MVALAKKHQPKEPSRTGRVLTGKEAFELLDANRNYMKSVDSHVGERHRSEIVAEAMTREGLDSLADHALQLHDVMKGFAQGDFKAAQHLADNPVIDSLVEDAKGTKFTTTADAMAAALGAFKRLTGEDIDWDKSSQVLAKAKRDHFPKDLTMVERLDQWQGDQAKRSL